MGPRARLAARTRNRLSFLFAFTVTFPSSICSQSTPEPNACTVSGISKDTVFTVYETAEVGTEIFNVTASGTNLQSLVATEGSGQGNIWKFFDFIYESSTGDGRMVVKAPMTEADTENLQFAFANFYMNCIFSDESTTPAFEGTARVILKDGNDLPPAFSQPTYDFTLPEDFPLSYDISLSVGASPIITTDGDKPENTLVTYTIKADSNDGVAAYGYFNIESQPSDGGGTEALLRLKKPLDFEQLDKMTFILIAENTNENDPFTPTQTAEAEITIIVQNVFDTPIQFTQTLFSVMMDDPNVSEGTTLVTATAVEEDAYGQITYELISSDETSSVLENFFEINPTSGEIKFKGNSLQDLVSAVNGRFALAALVQATPEINPLLRGSAVLLIEIDPSALSTQTVSTIMESTGTPDVTASIHGSTDKSSPISAVTETITGAQEVTSSTHDSTETSSRSGTTVTGDVNTSTPPSGDWEVHFSDKELTANMYTATANQPVFLMQAETNALNSRLFYKLDDLGDSQLFTLEQETGLLKTAGALSPSSDPYQIKVTAYLADQPTISDDATLSLLVEDPSALFIRRFYSASKAEKDLVMDAELFTLTLQPPESAIALEIFDIQRGEGCITEGLENSLRLGNDGITILFNLGAGIVKWHECKTGIYAKIREKVGTEDQYKVPRVTDSFFDVGPRETAFWLQVLDSYDPPTISVWAAGQQQLGSSGMRAASAEVSGPEPKAKVVASAPEDKSRNIRVTKKERTPHPVSFRSSLSRQSELFQPSSNQVRMRSSKVDEPVLTGYLSTGVDWRIPFSAIAECKLEDPLDDPSSDSLKIRIKEPLGDGAKFKLDVDYSAALLGVVSAKLVPNQLLDCKETCSLTIEYTDKEPAEWTEVPIEVSVLGPENLIFVEYASEGQPDDEEILTTIGGMNSGGAGIDFGLLYARSSLIPSRRGSDKADLFKVAALVFGWNDGNPKSLATFEEMEAALDSEEGIVLESFETGMETHCEIVVEKVTQSGNDGGKIASIVMNAILAVLLVALAVYTYSKIRKAPRRQADRFKEHRDTLMIKDPSIQGSVRGMKNGGLAF